MERHDVYHKSEFFRSVEPSICDLRERIPRRQSSPDYLHQDHSIPTEWRLRQSPPERQIHIHQSVESERSTTGGAELVIRCQLPWQRGRSLVGTADSAELFGLPAGCQYQQYHSAENFDSA